MALYKHTLLRESNPRPAKCDNTASSHCHFTKGLMCLMNQSKTSQVYDFSEQTISSFPLQLFQNIIIMIICVDPDVLKFLRGT